MSVAFSKMNGARAQRHNRALLLSTLRYSEGLSRAGLARATGLSTSAAAHLVNELLASGQLIETDERVSTARGRKGKVVRLNPCAAAAIGIELTDRELRALLVDFTEQPLIMRTHDVSRLDPPALLARLVETVAELLRLAPPGARVCGVGIAVQGLIDLERGISLTFPGMRGWQPIPLAEYVAKRVGARVRLQVRMLAATAAELRYGVGRECKDFFYINSAPYSGFGAGAVIDGQVVAGLQGYSGQFGHVRVDPDGRQCFCGSRGCLFTVASTSAVIEQAMTAVSRGVETSLAQRTGAGRELDFDDIVSAAQAGDKFSINLLDTTGSWLGLGLSYAVNLLNPGMVVLAGTLAAAEPFLMESMKRTCRQHTVAALFDSLRFVRSPLDANAGARGAALAMIDEVFAVAEAI